uniref:Ion_trans_2 domain-containing protein n=1 Tax=Heterorhabditis bacteriophora TaxID=37862 RepID=A0A1I7XE11_HETBA
MDGEDNEKLKGFWTRLRLRSVFLHFGLVATCIAYIILGAYMFRAIERPIELKIRKEALNEFEKLRIKNIILGYGYICPVSDVGKLLLIIYGIVGIPLALVTMADTGKFISQFVIRCFPEPNINVIHLVVFIVFGVILVTITIDFVAAELIDHIHYMGRHVGRAKQIAGKMLQDKRLYSSSKIADKSDGIITKYFVENLCFQIAQSLNMNRGISGLTAGMNQLQALARAGLLGKLDKEVLEKGRQMACAFAPVLDDMDFMDNASIYNSRMDLGGSPRGKTRMLLIR